MRSELLRFNGTVERDPAIDAWMKGHAGELGAIAHQWFEVTRSFNRRRFSQALLVALPMLALASTGLMFGMALPLPLFLKLDLAARLPLFLALLISMWIGAPSAACVDSKRIPA